MGNQSSERGPSYRDVVTAWEQLRARYTVGSSFEVFPATKYSTSSVVEPWRVTLKVWRTNGEHQNQRVYAQKFGGNGGWATMPAAMLACVREAYTALGEEEEREQEKQRPLF